MEDLEQDYEVKDCERDIKDCYNGNYNIAKAGISHNYTEEQISEIIKCKKDIIYFIEKYVKIVSMDEGLVKFKLYEYQKEMIHACKDERFVIFLLSRQMGKCLSYNSITYVRNNKTGEIFETSIGDFFNKIKLANI